MLEFRGSLLTRTTLVFAAATTVILALALILINVLVVAPLTQRAANNQAAMIELAANTYFELPFDRRAEYELQVLVDHGLLISSIKQDMPVASSESNYFLLLQSALNQRLGEQLAFYEGEERFWVDLPNPNEGSLELQIGFSTEQPFLTQQIVAIVVVILAAFIVIVTSFISVRRIARPLQRASQVTEQFRGDSTYEKLPEKGPIELRTLAANLNQMYEEITALIENRTALLAGISHDIRTPLTRMGLALELYRDELKPDTAEQLAHDLAQVDKLVENALEYAHGSREIPESVPFHSFITSLVDGIDAEIPLTWRGEQQFELMLAPIAFSRVISNLVLNAMEHAEEASLKVVVANSNVEIHVCDHGSGIPIDERAKVFRPFYRLDSARGGETSHSGLGLAIVRQLCDTFGWGIEIGDHDGGGADVCVTVERRVEVESVR